VYVRVPPLTGSRTSKCRVTMAQVAWSTLAQPVCGVAAVASTVVASAAPPAPDAGALADDASPVVGEDDAAAVPHPASPVHISPAHISPAHSSPAAPSPRFRL